MTKRLRRDAFEPHAGKGPGFGAYRAMGAAILVPVVVVVILATGGWDAISSMPWPFWAIAGGSFAWAVYALVTHT